MFLSSGGFYALLPKQNTGIDYPEKEVFDSFTKQQIPFTTLVIGYYFGTTAEKPENKKNLDAHAPLLGKSNQPTDKKQDTG